MPICCRGRSLASFSRPFYPSPSPLRGVRIPPPRGPVSTSSPSFSDPLGRCRFWGPRPLGADYSFGVPSPADRLRLIGSRRPGGSAPLPLIRRPLGAVSEVAVFPCHLLVAARWAPVVSSPFVASVASSRPVGAVPLGVAYSFVASRAVRWARVVLSCVILVFFSPRPVGAACFSERNGCGPRLRARWARRLFLPGAAARVSPRVPGAHLPSGGLCPWLLRSARWARCVALALFIASAFSLRRCPPSCSRSRPLHSRRLLARLFVAFRVSAAARLSSRPWARPLRPRPLMVRVSPAPGGRRVSARSCFAAAVVVAPAGRDRRFVARWSSTCLRARRARSCHVVSPGGLPVAGSLRAASAPWRLLPASAALASSFLRRSAAAPTGRGGGLSMRKCLDAPLQPPRCRFVSSARSPAPGGRGLSRGSGPSLRLSLWGLRTAGPRVFLPFGRSPIFLSDRPIGSASCSAMLPLVHPARLRGFDARHSPRPRARSPPCCRSSRESRPCSRASRVVCGRAVRDASPITASSRRCVRLFSSSSWRCPHAPTTQGSSDCSRRSVVA